MLSWNVFFGDFNHADIETYDIFRHASFLEDCRKLVKKFDQTMKKDGVFSREDFAKELRRELMYYFWSKCEWGIVITHWPPSERFRERKVDAFEQIQLNYDVFVDYVWSHREELIRCRKKK